MLGVRTNPSTTCSAFEQACFNSSLSNFDVLKYTPYMPFLKGQLVKKLKQAVRQLEERLQEKPKDKPLKKAVRTFRKDMLPRLQKYETQSA